MWQKVQALIRFRAERAAADQSLFFLSLHKLRYPRWRHIYGVSLPAVIVHSDDWEVNLWLIFQVFCDNTVDKPRTTFQQRQTGRILRLK